MPAYISWKPSLSVFVDEIDHQHQELYRRMDRFLGAVIEGEGSQEIGSILQFLIDYCVVHFGTEEFFMQRHDYPGYAGHKRAHERLTGDVLTIQRQVQNGSTRQHVISLVDSLGSWVAEHIQGMDKQLGVYLRTSQHEVPTKLPAGPRVQQARVNELTVRDGPACAHVNRCSVLFHRFRDPESNVFWQTRYCLSEQRKGCKRKQMIDAGSAASDIPITLLPNGDHLHQPAR